MEIGRRDKAPSKLPKLIPKGYLPNVSPYLHPNLKAIKGRHSPYQIRMQNNKGNQIMLPSPVRGESLDPTGDLLVMKKLRAKRPSYENEITKKKNKTMEKQHLNNESNDNDNSY